MAGNENSGGKRAGTTGKLYPNRSDLNTSPKNQPYGDRQQIEQSLATLPLTPSPTASPSSSPQTTGGPVGSPPPQVPQLTDPTMYPDEPVTSGLGSGPGAGPEALRIYNHGNEELSILRGIYAQTRSDDLRRLIEWMETNA